MINGVLPDPRRHAYRPDLAHDSLREHVRAERYLKGERKQVTAAALPVRREPRPDALLETEALLGETAIVLDEAEGWAWLQLERDRYVGYAPASGLSFALAAPTHRIAALRTYVFAAPDGKSLPLALLSMNAGIDVIGTDGKYLVLRDGGFVFAGHAAPVGETAPDYVRTAEQFLGAPYLWGGRTSVGLDCSGLVQLALEAAGIACPRDADMQEKECGRPVEQGALEMRRGDLVFWEGHVGIMTSPSELLHANAYHMAVEREFLDLAKARIKQAIGSDMTCVRRIEIRER